MYDKSLEQLIDAVVADGVITDQERKVVYNKAASLGIDQDEIQVYLEGRLDEVKQSLATKSGKIGNIRICPNCGAKVSAFAGICPECGHEFSGLKGNAAVSQLQKLLDDVDHRSSSSLWSLQSLDKEEKKREIIENFPIPNTKEDFLEFTTLCSSKFNGDQSETWFTKSKQIIEKGRILFGEDSNVMQILTNLEETRIKAEEKKNKASRKNNISGILFFSLLIILPLIGIIILEEEPEKYSTSLLEQIDNLPTPTVDNFEKCYRDFHKIRWAKETNDRWEAPYKAFCESKKSYAEILKRAYIKANVSENEIPRDLIDESLFLEQTKDGTDVNGTDISPDIESDTPLGEFEAPLDTVDLSEYQ